jgi:preprotein translocase subunit SecE
MASVTKNNDETDMVDDVSTGGEGAEDERDEREERDGDDEQRERRPAGKQPKHQLEYRPSSEGGFFHVYKSGQGYWTRMGTAATAALIILATCAFLYEYLPAWIGWLNVHKSWLSGIIIAFAAAMGLLTWYAINKPGNADFLIATDSEMKKVNWTSKTELIGSTKVVIFFMITIAVFLFMMDLFFGYLFYWLHVLKAKPF